MASSGNPTYHLGIQPILPTALDPELNVLTYYTDNPHQACGVDTLGAQVRSLGKADGLSSPPGFLCAKSAHPTTTPLSKLAVGAPRLAQAPLLLEWPGLPWRPHQSNLTLWRPTGLDASPACICSSCHPAGNQLAGYFGSVGPTTTPSFPRAVFLTWIFFDPQRCPDCQLHKLIVGPWGRSSAGGFRPCLYWIW